MPTNPVLDEVSKGYGYVEPSSFSSEVSRELAYNDLNLFKSVIVSDAHKKFNKATTSLGINTNFLDDYLLSYLFGSNLSNSLGKNQTLLKNQYRPLKKGVTNMIRLQATGAIAMPIEIRMHILASSRDVIHS